MAEERIKCPICAELIQPGAKKCRFCGEWLAGGREAKIGGVSREPPEAPEEEKEGEGYEGGAGESERKSPEPEPIRRV